MRNSAAKVNSIGIFYFFCWFTITYFIYSDFDIIKTSYGVIVYLLIAVLYAMKARGDFRVNGVKIFFLVLAGIVSLYILLPTSKLSKSTLLYLTTLLMAAFTVMICDPGRAEVEKTCNLLSAFSLLLAVYTLIIRAFPLIFYGVISPLLSSVPQRMNSLSIRAGYGVSIGGDSPYTMTCLCCGLIVLINRIFCHYIEPSKKISYYLCAGIIFFAMLMENKKSDVIAAVIVTLFIYVSKKSAHSYADHKKRILRLPIIVLLFLLVFVMLMSTGYLDRYVTFFNRIISNYVNGGTNHVDISSGRLYLWKLAYKLFKSSPVVGIGWGNYSNYTLDTFNTAKGRPLTTAHNAYLQLLCETGIIGFLTIIIPMLLIFVSTQRRAWRLRFAKTEEMHFAKTMNMISLSLQIYGLIAFFLEPSLYESFFWLFYGIAVILSAYAEKIERRYSMKGRAYSEI